MGHDARLVPLVALLSIAVYSAVLGLQPLEADALVTFSDVGMLLASCAASWCAVVAARRQQDRRARRSWTLMALGLGSWCVGDVIWAAYPFVTGDQTPTVSWADPWYLLMMPLCFAGIVLRPAH